MNSFVMKRLAAVGALVFAAAGPSLFAVPATAPARDLLIEIRRTSPQALAKALPKYDDYAADPVVSLVRGTALALATPAEFAALKSAGFDATLVLESPDPLTLCKRALYGPTLRLPECYHTYAQIVAGADALAAAHPDLIAKIMIGETTAEHRPIYAFRLSNDARHSQDRPRLLFDGCHHSDEVMGAEICYALLQKLVTDYGRDPEITGWMERDEIFIVPVVNVDGYERVTAGVDPRWRKNADNGRGGATGAYGEGVDVNRNYDFNWAQGGSGDPRGETYRGPYPFSEAENRAMRDLALRERFLLSISYHSQGEVIYYPWSWNGRLAPDDTLIKGIARDIAARIPTMDGKGRYAVSPGGASCQSYVWLYGATGDFDFLVETGRGAHIFPPAEAPGIIAANLAGVRALFAHAAGPGLTGRVTDAATGRPLDATVWFPAIETEDVHRRTGNAEFGRYWRLLRPGAYYVIVSKPGYRTAVFPAATVREGGWTELNVALQPE